MTIRGRTILAALSATVLIGSLAPAPADDVKERVAALGKQRLALIRQAIALEKRRNDAGEGSTQAARMWTRRLVDAQRQSGADRKDYIAALKDLVEIETRNETNMQTMYKQGGVTQLGLLDAQDTLLEAKILLEEAGAK